MNLDIFRMADPSGKMSKESYVMRCHKEEYDFILEYCERNGMGVCTFKEKVFLTINEHLQMPKCQNDSCGNAVKFKNSTLGYLSYCSNKCISSDPKIKRRKESKSLERYGTKTPAQSKEVKDRIIETNNRKWGGNSPMSSEKTKEKARKTLFRNWGVANPSHSKDILSKRIESFKNSEYKESYKKTSLQRYGVNHPWKDKDIHKKTIEIFYRSYRDRILEKTENSDFEFVKFEKIGLDTNLIFNCKECKNEFSILPYQFYYRINQKNSICTQCFPISENSSIDQAELYNFIKCNYDGEIIQNTKSIIAPYEIDIYLPALKIGFEFNGVFWHSAKFKKNDYHLKKYNEGVKNDVRIITIWEDDWTTKREICQSFILNKIRKVNRVMARKTILREVDYLSSKDFLYKNHLQGDCKSSIRLGLYHEGELVSLMTFSKLRMPLGGKNAENTYELTRFCNSINTSVTGGASKLKKYFIEKYKPVEIQTYSDNLISDGELYEKLGFNNESDSKPGYWYVVNGIREHRFNWRKQRLIKMGHDKEKTEEEIMAELGYWRIYNAGNKKWIWRIN